MNKCKTCGEPATIEVAEQVQHPEHVDDLGTPFSPLHHGEVSHFCEKHFECSPPTNAL